MSTDLRRTTVNLNRPAVAALDALVAVYGDSRTDAVNRALVAHSFLVEKLRSGAELKLRHPNGDVEAVTFL